MPEGIGYGKKKPKKKLPAWTNQAAGSVAVGKSKKTGKSLLEKSPGKKFVVPKKKVKKKTDNKNRPANKAATRQLLRGVLTGEIPGKKRKK